MYAFSAVPNQPILDRRSFPSLDVLRDNWEVIRDEGLTLYNRGDVKASDAYDDAGFNSFFRRGWKRFYLKWYGEPLASARRECPKTVALLEGLPGVKAAMFAMLPPAGNLFVTVILLPDRCATTWALPVPIVTSVFLRSTASVTAGATARISCSTRPLFITQKTVPTPIV